MQDLQKQLADAIKAIEVLKLQQTTSPGVGTKSGPPSSAAKSNTATPSTVSKSSPAGSQAGFGGCKYSVCSLLYMICTLVVNIHMGVFKLIEHIYSLHH